jgi:hypothetical protein
LVTQVWIAYWPGFCVGEGAMAELKTKETKASVTAFLKKIVDQERREDCFAIVEIMRAATKEEPKMWGPSIVGFGRYRYRYESGREGEWPIIGFSPRKNDLTLYFMRGFDEYPDLIKRLGKHKTAKSCLYLKKLADVDMSVLKELVKRSLKAMESQRIKQPRG